MCIVHMVISLFVVAGPCNCVVSVNNHLPLIVATIFFFFLGPERNPMYTASAAHIKKQFDFIILVI